MLNLISVIDFFLLEIKNKIIILDDLRFEVVMIFEIKLNMG